MGNIIVRFQYKVEEFRRILPDVGIAGRGLVQFWGVKAFQKFDSKTRKTSAWEVESERRLHTLDINDISNVTDGKRG